jgi:hypothetical protein
VEASIVAIPFVPVELAPPLDSDEIDISLEMGRDINLAVSRSCVEELEALVRPLVPEAEIRVQAQSGLWILRRLLDSLRPLGPGRTVG